MVTVTQKTEIEPIDGTPVKRMFWSIISDYDLKTGICELVDNAVDLWGLTNRSRRLTVSINLDAERQLISVIDNAGGVKRQDLRLLIAPGGSRNDPAAEVIGVFGVGSKRAAIALAEHVVIKTRFRDEESSERYHSRMGRVRGLAITGLCDSRDRQRHDAGSHVAPASGPKSKRH